MCEMFIHVYIMYAMLGTVASWTVTVYIHMFTV